jgi:hypothetical protein
MTVILDGSFEMPFLPGGLELFESSPTLYEVDARREE